MTDSAGITRPAVLAVINDAGSAGKTTSAVTIAAAAAEAGLRVLVVDLDPQANATRWLGVDDDAITGNSGDVLLKKATVADVAMPTNTERVQLVPASESLKHQRIELGRATGAEQRLRLALSVVDVDVVVLDCQAGAGELLPITALVAATAVISTAFPGAKELEGLPRVEAMVDDVREAYNPGLVFAAVIPCAVPSANRGALYGAAVAALREAYGDLVTPSVRHSVTAVAAYDARLPLTAFAPRAGVTDDYRDVLSHLRAAGVMP